MTSSFEYTIFTSFAWKEDRKMSLKRMFSLKRRSNEKPYDKVLQSQDKITDKLSFLADDNRILRDNVVSANKRVEQFVDKVEEVLKQNEEKEKYNDNIRSQLHKSQQTIRALNKELKEAEKSQYTTKIRMCRCIMDIRAGRAEASLLQQRITCAENQLSEKSCELKTYQEESQKLNSEIKNLENKTAKLEKDISELNSKIRYEEDKSEREKEANISLHGEIQELKNRMKDMNAVNEGRLKTVWIKFHEMKQQRDQLYFQITHQSAVSSSPNKNLSIDSDDFKDVHHETRVMKLEMKLYRCRKLVELLTDRLRVYEPKFVVQKDSELKVYLDSDINEVLLSDNFEENIDTASSSSTMSQTDPLSENCDTLKLLKLIDS